MRLVESILWRRLGAAGGVQAHPVGLPAQGSGYRSPREFIAAHERL